MDISFVIFISSGLFLGWSLGANDAANIFGTAVGTRMIRFFTAAVICSVFVILGAVISGGGTSATIAEFGGVNRIAGAFMVALAAALAVFMTLRSGITASTSQAIIGALIGWNLYSDSVLDTTLLLEIISTWLLCPLLAGAVAIVLYWLTEFALNHASLHLLTQDALTRVALICTGALGAYALGANNIGNVMGVFVDVAPFRELRFSAFSISATEQLFLLGGIAIAVGVFTYSRKVMMTIGNGIMEISPVAAWIVVMAHSIVLLMFSSTVLQQRLLESNLPTLPLVPVSSSQAVVGAMIGLAAVKGGGAINWSTLGKIGKGWMITPLTACLITLPGLFLLDHIGQQEVAGQNRFRLAEQSFPLIEQAGIETWPYRHLVGVPFTSEQAFIDRINGYQPLNPEQQKKLIYFAHQSRFELNYRLYSSETDWLSPEQWQSLQQLKQRSFQYRWQLRHALAEVSTAWQTRPDTIANHQYNQLLEQQYQQLERLLEIPPETTQNASGITTTDNNNN